MNMHKVLYKAPKIRDNTFRNDHVLRVTEMTTSQIVTPFKTLKTNVIAYYIHIHIQSVTFRGKLQSSLLKPCDLSSLRENLLFVLRFTQKTCTNCTKTQNAPIFNLLTHFVTTELGMSNDKSLAFLW